MAIWTSRASWLSAICEVRTLHIDVLKTCDCIALLAELIDYEPLRDLSIKVLRKYRSPMHVDTIDGEVPFGALVDSVARLIGAKCAGLESVKINLREWARYRQYRVQPNKTVDYWHPYIRLLKALLSMTQDGIFFDGYLEFFTGVGSAFHNAYEQNNISGIASSLKVTQSITALQTRFRQRNDALDDANCSEKKLILYFPELMLHSQHKRFLRFWFGQSPELIRENWLRWRDKLFVLY